MITHKFLPHPSLQPYIHSYCYSEPTDYPSSFTMDLLPIGHGFLCIALAEGSFISISSSDTNAIQVARTSCNVAGLTTRHYKVDVHPIPALHIAFKPSGLYRLFRGLPQEELTDAGTSLYDIMPLFKDVHNKLIELNKEPGACVDLIEGWLLKQIVSIEMGGPDITGVCKIIERGGGNIDMADLYTLANMSKRSFNRHFKEQTGITAKLYSRIIRFNEVQKYMKKQASHNWNDLVDHCNFFDQAHFIHDFKHFCGHSPSQFHQKIKNIAEHLSA